jgi:hypothetical protein
MLFYHLGVAVSLQDHCDLAKVVFCGASCGSLVAAALAIGVPISELKNFAMKMHSAADARFWGPAGHMSHIVRGGLEAMLPDDAHELLNAQDRPLAVSVSLWESIGKFKNKLDRRPRFESRTELITLLLCSCYIPLYVSSLQEIFLEIFCSKCIFCDLEIKFCIYFLKPIVRVLNINIVPLFFLDHHSHAYTISLFACSTRARRAIVRAANRLRHSFWMAA